MTTFHKAPFGLSALEEAENNILLSSTLFKKHNIFFSSDLFNEENMTLSQLLKGKSALFVTTEGVEQLYGKKIRNYLKAKKESFDSSLLVIKSGEHNKNLTTVAAICQEANNFSLKRNHPIVAIGGGICLDMCGLAAALFRRGIPHIKIPTTFLGLIDAGIATKNGVNLGAKKNLIGTFYPPEATLVDASFLKTLPLRHIVCGIAESIKMGLVVDSTIYKMWLQYGQLISHVQISDDIIRLSIVSMMQELSYNLYEYNCYKRAVDFGHTFSPFIEQVSNYDILHGEAVSIDMALSCQISYLKGLISLELLDEILSLFQNLGLPLYTPLMDCEALWQSLRSIVAHRGGNLNLVIPSGIGKCHFLEKLTDLESSCLQEALSRLQNYDEKSRCYAVEH